MLLSRLGWVDLLASEDSLYSDLDATITCWLNFERFRLPAPWPGELNVKLFKAFIGRRSRMLSSALFIPNKRTIDRMFPGFVMIL